MDLTSARVKDLVKLSKDICLDEATINLSKSHPGSIVVGGSKWAFLSDVLDPPHGHEFLESGRSIDARVLISKAFTHGKFLPPGSPEFVDIQTYKSSFFGSGNHSDNVAVAVDMSKNSEVEIDIVKKFEDGDYEIAQTRGAPVLDIRKSKVEKGVNKVGVKRAIFREGNKLFCIDLDILKSFKSLGFTIRSYVTEKYPVTIISSELFRAVGVIYPEKASGIFVSPDGRRIGYDAAEVCWISEEDARDRIEREVQSFRPFGYRTGRADVSDIDSIVNDKLGGLCKPVSALRWLGSPDHQISKILKVREYEAWFSIHQEILGRARDKLQQALSNTGSVGYLESQAKQMCDELDTLQKVMRQKGNPETLELGVIPQLIEYLKEARA